LNSLVVGLVAADQYEVVDESDGGDQWVLPPDRLTRALSMSRSALSTGAQGMPLASLHRFFDDLVHQLGHVRKHSQDRVLSRSWRLKLRQGFLDQFLHGHLTRGGQTAGASERFFI
jgi:hypothetical protein